MHEQVDLVHGLASIAHLKKELLVAAVVWVQFPTLGKQHWL